MEIRKTTNLQGTQFLMKTLFLAIILLFNTSVMAESILAIRYDSEHFVKALNGMRDELDGEFDIKELVLSDKVNEKTVHDNITSVKPKIIVLMDNKAIKLYKSYLEKHKEFESLPVLVLMAVSVKDQIEGIKNCTAISYEVPIVTSVLNLKTVMNEKLEKVGVIHREIMQKLIDENIMYASTQGIKVIPKSISSKKAIPDMKKQLKVLAKDDKVDVIWLLNDNVLLSQEALKGVWMPFVKKYKLPVIVGIEALVNPKFDLGLFAVLPDHFSLGVQAAEMIFEIVDNDFNASDIDIQPPLSVRKVLNLKQGKDYFGIKEGDAISVDKILK